MKVGSPSLTYLNFQNHFFSKVLLILSILVLLVRAGQRRCTGFFCMDESFFNHLGPFFETTPPVIHEQITEKSEILPKVVNNQISWSLPLQASSSAAESVGETIYEDEESYDPQPARLSDADYQWKPYEPTENHVDVAVDELTAPFGNKNSNLSNSAEDKNDVIENEAQQELPFLQNFYTDYEYYDDQRNEAEAAANQVNVSCPSSSRCRCVCDPS